MMTNPNPDYPYSKTGGSPPTSPREEPPASSTSPQPHPDAASLATAAPHSSQIPNDCQLANELSDTFKEVSSKEFMALASSPPPHYMQDFAKTMEKLFDSLHLPPDIILSSPLPISPFPETSQAKHLHILRFPCPTCSFTTDLKAKVLLPSPGSSFPPNPIIRIHPPTLDCGHGDIPPLLTVKWFSQVLQSFNFELGYSLINQNGEIKHFPPQKPNPPPK